MKTKQALDVTVIQGGMGVYISTPFLANTVSRLGALGTVSGTAPERVLVRILQAGDQGGHYRRALAQFPFPEIAELVLKEYFIEGGWRNGMPRKGTPVFSINPSRSLIALTLCANYAFVWLAKEGHDHPISINYLEKIAMPHVYALTGALLAGVDYVTMGAGIPLAIPGLMRDIAEGREARYDIPVIGERIKSHTMTFDPARFFGCALPMIEVPGFIPIIASNLLAGILMKRLDEPLRDLAGFVIEEPAAGGHNAPPRTKVPDASGGTRLTYGEKDKVDYRKIADIGLPFWIGGSYASPEKLREARATGATGIQAGTIFALCEESGLRPDIRREVRAQGFERSLHVKTDMEASPTGFPFKVASLQGTLSDPAVLAGRERACDQGALASLYEKPDGSIGYRCPAEPVGEYVRKGGKLEDTVNRCCLCNGLLNATILAESEDAPIVTLGDDLGFIPSLMTEKTSSYDAAQALAYLRG
ncbi:MAG: nitronate monooxygenase [Patescibacteria group bacterium]